MTIDDFRTLFFLAFIGTVICRYIHINNSDPIPYEEEEKGILELEEQETNARNFCKQLGIAYKIKEPNQTAEKTLNEFFHFLKSEYFHEGGDIQKGQKEYLAKKEDELFQLQEELKRLKTIEASGVDARSFKEVKKEETKETKEIENIMNDDDFL